MDKCEGCGRSAYSLIEVRVGPQLRFAVCQGRQFNVASKKCLQEAQAKKQPVCPGCGAQAAYQGVLCGACISAMELGRAEGQRRDGDAEAAPWFVVVSNMLLGANLNTGDLAIIADCLRIISRGDRVREGHGSNVISEHYAWDPTRDGGRRWHEAYVAHMTPAQAQATKGMLNSIRRSLVNAEKEGYRHGSSTLSRLATGDMSVLDFESVSNNQTSKR